MGYLGVGEGDPGEVVVAELFFQGGEEVEQQQAHVQLGPVAELEGISRVAGHKDVGVGRLQVLIKLDVALLIDFHTGLVQLQALEAYVPPDGHVHQVEVDRERVAGFRLNAGLGGRGEGFHFGFEVNR